MKDVNDAVRGGVSLDDLIAAAEQSDPVIGSDWSKLFERGLELLRDLVVKVTSAQDRDAALRLVLEAQGNESVRRTMGAAMHFRRADAVTHLSALGLGPVQSTTIRQFTRVLEDEARKVESKLGERDERYRAIVLDRLTERALGLKGFRLPAGYEMDSDGLRTSDGEVLTRAPTIISGVSQDIATGRYRMDVAWFRDGEWTIHGMDRERLMSARTIVELAGYGAPISSGNAAEMVKFFEAFEACNIKLLAPKRCSERMGWVGNDTFVYGKSSYGVPIEVTEIDANRKLVAGVAQAGTWDGWCSVIDRHVRKRPLVMIGVYASVASLLLHVLDQPGFVVEWSGMTSRGKTTTLRVAASVVGVPDDKGNGLIYSWKARSPAPFMYSAYVLQSMPLILDDTKRQTNHEVIATMIYDHPSGQDSNRGTSDGKMRATNRWRSILLSTGEAPITSFSRDGGARARALCLRGSPFGDESQSNQKATNEVREGLLAHHGHLGRKVIEHLLQPEPVRSKVWATLRMRYKAALDGYTASATDAISCRLYEYVAAITVAARLAHELGVPGDEEEALRVLASFVEEGATEADMPAAALESLYRWAAANEEKFYGRGQREPANGWLGRWDRGNLWRYIGFNEDQAVEMLRRWGYDAPSVIENWSERGWTLHEGGSRPRARPRWGPGRAPVLAIKREAFGDVGDE